MESILKSNGGISTVIIFLFIINTVFDNWNSIIKKKDPYIIIIFFYIFVIFVLSHKRSSKAWKSCRFSMSYCTHCLVLTCVRVVEAYSRTYASSLCNVHASDICHAANKGSSGSLDSSAHFILLDTHCQ